MMHLVTSCHEAPEVLCNAEVTRQFPRWLPLLCHVMSRSPVISDGCHNKAGVTRRCWELMTPLLSPV